MDPSAFSADILDQQLSLWSRLALALEHAQAALLSGDIACFEQHTEEQRLCCARLVANGGVTAARNLGAIAESERAILVKIERTQRAVQRLARIHAALLRRAGRSLTILRNLLARNRVAYTPFPSSHDSPFDSRRG